MARRESLPLPGQQVPVTSAEGAIATIAIGNDLLLSGLPAA